MRPLTELWEAVFMLETGKSGLTESIVLCMRSAS